MLYNIPTAGYLFAAADTSLAPLVGIVTAGFALLGAAMAWRSTRIGAEGAAAKAVTEANVALITEVRSQLAEERHAREQLEAYITTLTRALIAAGIEVPPRGGGTTP